MRPLALALWLGAVGGCQERSSAPPDPSATPPSAASPPAAPGPSGSASGRAARPAVGGAWVTCHGRFRPGGAPIDDLRRLGERCGAGLGLRPMGEPWEGKVAEKGPPDVHPIELGRGACVRAMAIGSAGVSDLDLTLLDPAGALVATEGVGDRWPMLLPDRTVCVRAAGTYGLRVSARRGEGSFAAQVWLVP